MADLAHYQYWLYFSLFPYLAATRDLSSWVICYYMYGNNQGARIAQGKYQYVYMNISVDGWANGSATSINCNYDDAKFIVISSLWLASISGYGGAIWCVLDRFIWSLQMVLLTRWFNMNFSWFLIKVLTEHHKSWDTFKKNMQWNSNQNQCFQAKEILHFNLYIKPYYTSK